jgi:hypothetical protein
MTIMSDLPNGADGPDDDLVLTPGGRRPRHLVHRVGPGEAARPGQIPPVGPPPPAGVRHAIRRRPVAGNLVLTPGGYRHPALVRRVEPGHAVEVAAADRVRLVNLKTKAATDVARPTLKPGDVPGMGTGWITYAHWQNSTGTPVSSFRTTWRVPPAPATDNGQTIFLFNGIDPANTGDAILQPVLQWGSSYAGGGSYWSIASWYVLGNGQAFYTDLIPVNSGDTLVGVMKLTGQAGGKFSYTSEFEGVANTTLPVLNVAELVWCNETLEAYDVQACSDYPDTDRTPMYAIELRTGDLTPAVHWTPEATVTDCGQHTNVVADGGTNGEVDLYYRPGLLGGFDWRRLATQVRILYGVTNDGGGIVILPNGHIIRIPPRNPLFQRVAAGLAEAGRGFGIGELVDGSALPAEGNAVRRAGLELMAKGLEGALGAVKADLARPNG